MKKRPLTIAIAVMLVAVCAVGGTLAWLTAQSGPVTNTFTESNIDITLAESKNLDLQMVPGHTITKDPVVTVKDGSEDCYLFVEITKANDFDHYMTFTPASGWTAISEGSDVYYRIVKQGDAEKEFRVLENNQVTVKGTVTKTEMDALETVSAEKKPQLIFKAYATQYYKTNGTPFSVAEAWQAAQGNAVE